MAKGGDYAMAGVGCLNVCRADARFMNVRRRWVAAPGAVGGLFRNAVNPSLGASRKTSLFCTILNSPPTAQGTACGGLRFMNRAIDSVAAIEVSTGRLSADEWCWACDRLAHPTSLVHERPKIIPGGGLHGGVWRSRTVANRDVCAEPPWTGSRRSWNAIPRRASLCLAPPERRS